MRKNLAIVGLIVFCFVCSIMKSNKEQVISVFNSKEEYNIYLLDVSKSNITTLNLTDYFENGEILEIYPYINPIYKKLINITSFPFNTAISNKKNISNFISECSNKLKENALTSESLKINLNGIKIIKLKVYTSSKNIKKIVNNNSIKIIN